MTTHSSPCHKLRSRLEAHLEAGRGKVCHPDTVHRPVASVERHVVGYKAKMSGIHCDPVRAEDSSDLRHDRCAGRLDAVGLAHCPYIIARELLDIGVCTAGYMPENEETGDMDLDSRPQPKA